MDEIKRESTGDTTPENTLLPEVTTTEPRLALQSKSRLIAGGFLMVIGLWSLFYQLDWVMSPWQVLDFIDDYAEYIFPIVVTLCGVALLVRAFGRPRPAEPVAEAATAAVPRRQFTRSTTEKRILGIAGGLAEYFEWDVTLTRIALFLSIFLTSGFSILCYFVLAFITPTNAEVMSKTRSTRPEAETPQTMA
jgi:phage shock protein C